MAQFVGPTPAQLGIQRRQQLLAAADMMLTQRLEEKKLALDAMKTGADMAQQAARLQLETKQFQSLQRELEFSKNQQLFNGFIGMAEKLSEGDPFGAAGWISRTAPQEFSSLMSTLFGVPRQQALGMLQRHAQAIEDGNVAPDNPEAFDWLVASRAAVAQSGGDPSKVDVTQILGGGVQAPQALAVPGRGAGGSQAPQRLQAPAGGSSGQRSGQQAQAQGREDFNMGTFKVDINAMRQEPVTKTGVDMGVSEPAVPQRVQTPEAQQVQTNRAVQDFIAWQQEQWANPTVPSFDQLRQIIVNLNNQQTQSIMDRLREIWRGRQEGLVVGPRSEGGSVAGAR